MPPKTAKAEKAEKVEKVPLFLVCGDEDISVKRKAQQIFQTWCAELPGDHETVQAYVTHSGEALKALGQLREAMQTLPFFGGGKVIWFKDCNFLSDDRTSASAAVTEGLNDLSKDFKSFPWSQTRLLISAGKVDKRRSFFKTIDELGTVQYFAGWSAEDRGWAEKAEGHAEAELTGQGKNIASSALAALVQGAGPNKRLLENEVEKLILYVGNRSRITLEDVETVTVKNKSAQAFALGDALGDRNLPKLLTLLDQELWGLKFDSSRNEIGLLYGLISKMRALLLAKALIREKLIRPDSNYPRFKTQLESLAPDRLPQDKRINPLAISPYVLYRGAEQCVNYSESELVKAMELLLECNQKLVSSSLEPALVLQRALVQIANKPEPAR